MDRREFHKTALSGALAAAGLLTDTAATPAAEAIGVPPLPHPGDALPAGATLRLGTTRLWHLAERGNEGLNDLTFSPNGRLLAALGYQDGCLSVWEVPSGRLLRKWEADRADRCGELAFSPCGHWLAVGSNDGVRLWDPHTGCLLRQLLADVCVYGIVFSPDGRLLAAAIPYFGRVDVWEVARGELVARFDADPHPIWPGHPLDKSDRFHGVAFSADGRLVAAGSEFELYHDIQDPKTEELRQQLLARHASVGTTGRGDKTYLLEPRGRVWCWELATGRRLAKLEGHEFPVKRVRFTPDGRLVSCATDGAIWLWDVATGQRVTERLPSLQRVYTSAVDITDDRLALVSRPGYLGVLDLLDGNEVRRFPVDENWRGWMSLAVAPGGRWAATDAGGRIRLWDGVTGADVSPAARHGGWVRAVRFSADGSLLATATAAEAMLWDAVAGRLLRQVSVRDGLAEHTLALAADGRRAACAFRRQGGDGYAPPARGLAVWDWASGAVREWDDIQPSALAWSPAGDCLLVGTQQGDVFRLRLPEGRREPLLRITDGVQSIAVAPDGRLVAVVGREPVVYVAGLQAGPRQLQARGFPHPPMFPFRPDGRPAFSADGRILILTDTIGRVWAGGVDADELPQVFDPPSAPFEPSLEEFASGLLPDGRLLVAGSEALSEPDSYCACFIRVWDAASRREIWKSPTQRHVFTALSFSPDARLLASGGADGTALLWDWHPRNLV
jgi:WD40 repeat protein